MPELRSKTRALVLAATATSVASGAALVAPQVAVAGEADEAGVDSALACRVYSDVTDQHSTDGHGYWYTNTYHSVPTSSPCHDIQVQVGTASKSNCVYFRVHYPGVANNGWDQHICTSDWVVLRAGVPDGTQYRIESGASRSFTVGD